MSAAPQLTAEHVRRAIAEIDEDGVPHGRGSTKYELVVDGRRYPPKYTLGRAMRHATGRELRADEHYGGEQCNGKLRELGFVVVEKGESAGTTSRVVASAPKPRRPAVTHAPAVPPLRPSAEPRRNPAAAPSVARVVVRGQPSGEVDAAASMLLEAFGNRWPAPAKTLFTITPGGFLCAPFPARWRGGLGWSSRTTDFAPLVSAATPAIGALLSPSVLAAARARTKLLTIGVDLQSPFGSAGPEAELVAVVDTATGKIVRWTGKSYPTSEQEHELVQVTDLATHAMEVDGERVLVLGCHDLNLFGNRGYANQREGSLRRQRCDEMRALSDRFKPTMVLQHPHSTDSANIWGMSWGSLRAGYPSVQVYASGIGFHNWNKRVRGDLASVLTATRSAENVFDVVVAAR